ncbi:hypothetical protein [Caballeronia humi]|uniref:hypothetical protein n=1 Tax=Caballeronia humi TaxID=326474 RepID=UPI000F73B8CE|nr:hypothetical protein [Caballeronia humi]
MTSENKYPGFKRRLIDAIRARAPSINATRAQARKSSLNLESPAHFIICFNEGFKGDPLSQRTAGNWLKGNHLPSEPYRAHLAWLLHERWYFLEHGVKPGKTASPHTEARQPELNYIELPTSLRIDPSLEMLPVEEKEPIKGIVREINKLIDGLVNKKRPE